MGNSFLPTTPVDCLPQSNYVPEKLEEGGVGASDDRENNGDISVSIECSSNVRKAVLPFSALSHGEVCLQP